MFSWWFVWVNVRRFSGFILRGNRFLQCNDAKFYLVFAASLLHKVDDVQTKCGNDLLEFQWRKSFYICRGCDVLYKLYCFQRCSFNMLCNLNSTMMLFQWHFTNELLTHLAISTEYGRTASPVIYIRVWATLKFKAWDFIRTLRGCMAAIQAC